jgi:hypothetical protein
MDATAEPSVSTTYRWEKSAEEIRVLEPVGKRSSSSWPEQPARSMRERERAGTRDIVISFSTALAIC